MQAANHSIDSAVSRLAVSPAEAARLAGLGRTKLYEAISSGALPSFRIGTRRLIRVSALDAWLKSFETSEQG